MAFSECSPLRLLQPEQLRLGPSATLRVQSQLLGICRGQQILAWAELTSAQGQGLIHQLGLAEPSERHFEILMRALQQTHYRLDADCQAAYLPFYEQSGWLIQTLAAGPKAYWLDPGPLLEPDFRFPAPAVQPLRLPAELSLGHQARLRILRLDLLHPLLSGNKWFKLRPHLLEAQTQGKTSLLTLGGAWSNHLYACAAAGKLLGFQTRALIRGELPEPLNPVLSFARSCGMELIPISRTRYRELRSEQALAELRRHEPQSWVIPEGGASPQGISGAAQMLEYLPQGTSALALACGTATSLMGLLSGPPELQILGVAVLKGADFLADQIRHYLQVSARSTYPLWELETRFHCGGYAKSSPELQGFLEAFAALNPEIPLEPVYTGKLLYALNQKLLLGEKLPDGLVVVHTGGIYPDQSVSSS